MGDDKFSYNTNGSKWGAVGEPIPLRVLLERVSIDDPEFKENGFESPEDPQHNTDLLSNTRRGHSIYKMLQINNQTHNGINGINGNSGTRSIREATASSGMPSVIYMPPRLSIQQSLAAREAFLKASAWTYETRGTRETLASQPQRLPFLQSGAAREALREASVGTIDTWGTRGTRQGTASPAVGAFSLPQQYPILQSGKSMLISEVKVTSSGIRGIRGNTGTNEAAVPLYQSCAPRKVTFEPNDPRRYINDPPGVALELSILGAESSALKECTFCKQNGEQPFFYQGHNLTDSLGQCECPVLSNLTCPLCEHTGKNASHTYTHCPKVRRQSNYYNNKVSYK